MAPVVKALKDHSHDFTPMVVVTAQHREMLDQVLEVFDLTVDYDLNIMSPGQSLFDITIRVLEGLKGILLKEAPDMVLVHGDTTTTFAASLASFYTRTPIGHVEAGLRTYDKYQPYPEEANRCLTSVLGELHFAPTLEAKENLLKENISPESIYVTGNTVIDALLSVVDHGHIFEEPILNSLKEQEKRLIIVEAHRRENLGRPMEEIALAVKDVAQTYPDVNMLLPLHKNPLVREVFQRTLHGMSNVYMIEPPDYKSFANLLNMAYMVVTDSGGLQEEAPALGVPVLVLRNVTERPEAVKAGTVKLIGCERENVSKAMSLLLDDQGEYTKMASAANPYGDGHAAKKIIDAICEYFSL
jgi:UDP-N-acetylglucosamine 2-epimerase (non-hydrolysing)